MSSERLIETRELWLAGNRMGLDIDYPTPTEDELVDAWREYDSSSNPIAIDHVFGTISHPEKPISRLASIDLCEVLRGTADAIMTMRGLSVIDMDGVHNYGPAIGCDQNDVVPIVQTLMNNNLVRPAEDAAEIKTIMQGWRNMGILCVANTSTLPGCEIPTLRFLKEHYPDCFDGILLPRNYDGSQPLTKGLAARNTLERLSGSVQPIAVHIDDAPHHNAQFLAAMTERRIPSRAFMPAYSGNETVPLGVIRTETTLAAFEQAEEVFSHKSIGLEIV